MDHGYIEDENIAERYQMGRLSEGERAEFELHFLDCSQCTDALEEIGELRRALTTAGAFGRAERRRARPAWPVFAPRWVAAFASALVLVLLLCAGFLLSWNRRLDRELDEARAGLTEVEARVQELEKPARGASEGGTTAPTGNGGSDNSRAAGNGNAPGSSPRVNTPIFVLSAMRGSSDSNVITLSSPSEWFVISLELESAPQYKSYRATISSSRGAAVWVGNDLRPNRYDALTMSFNSSFFHPGEYQIALDGIQPGAPPVAMAVFPFRVVKKK